MRLLRLYVGDYRVLRDVDIYFDYGELRDPYGKYHLDFLVGVNGTGKSTLLRFLLQLFHALESSSIVEAPFILEYWLDSQKSRVRISNIHPISKSPLDRYFVTVTSELTGPYPEDEPKDQSLVDKIPVKYLPTRIIAYTTGNESEWELKGWADLLDASSVNVLGDFRGNKSAIEARTLHEFGGWPTPREENNEAETTSETVRFVRQGHLSLVALTGLLLHQLHRASPLEEVLRHLRIDQLAGFSFQFDLNYATVADRNAVWKFANFATRAIRSAGRFLLVFDLSTSDCAEKLFEDNGGAMPFFERLVKWSEGASPILSHVNLFFNRLPNQTEAEFSPPVEEPAAMTPPPIEMWNWLSDGERSFLGRMCLFLLFGEMESLILLDEPEVHFNDYWKRHIVSMMHEVFEKKQHPHFNHVLIATHSSISLSDVQREDILVLDREAIFTSRYKKPSINTFGADPSDIIVHVFNAPYSTGAHSVKQVEKWIQNSSEQDLAVRREFLERRLKDVAPGYWSYRIRRALVGLQ